MRILGCGHFLFAIGLAGLGFLSLISGDFAFTWQPVPKSVPWRETLAHLSGILLLAGGLGLLIKRTAKCSAVVMTIYLLTWVLFLQGPIAAGAPTQVWAWLGVAENLVMTIGGWTLFASLTGPEDKSRLSRTTGPKGTRVSRILFGASCLVLGLSHFVYSDPTTAMVPAWLPNRLGFAYVTGIGHLAAGVGILLGILPRLAATLEALMISLFALLLHLPAVVKEPASRMQWTMLFVAIMLAGAVWTIARSLQSEPWGLRRKN